jgi:hypothetical protein
MGLRVALMLGEAPAGAALLELPEPQLEAAGKVVEEGCEGAE